MKFHTKLTMEEMRSVKLPAGVQWHRLEQQGSRSRARKFDIVLEGSGITGGRWGNSGTHGAAPYKSATWDEWGVVLGELFELDPDAIVPGVYKDADDYHWQTGHRFVPGSTPDVLCPRHIWDYTGHYSDIRVTTRKCKKCGATMRWHY